MNYCFLKRISDKGNVYEAFKSTYSGVDGRWNTVQRGECPSSRLDGSSATPRVHLVVLLVSCCSFSSCVVLLFSLSLSLSLSLSTVRTSTGLVPPHLTRSSG